MDAPLPVSTAFAAGNAENAVSGGFPIPHTDSANSSIDLNAQLLIHPDSSFLFKVSSDAMSGIGIFRDDRIIVDRAIEPRHGHIVLAVVGGEFMVRRFFRKGRIVRLVPENDADRPIDFASEDELQIWGVVTACLRRLL